MVEQNPTLQRLFDLALRHHQLNQLSEAQNLYQQILQVQPNNADSLHWLGVLAFQMGQYRTAIDLIHKAIQFNPHDAAYYTHLGNALKAENRLAEAIAYHQKALQIKPQDAAILNDLGICFDQLEEWQAAIDCYQQSLDNQPNNAKVRNNIANTLVQLNKIDEAITHYQIAIALSPDLAGPYAGLGNALRHINRMEEAIIACQRAIELDPQLTAVYITLGLILVDKGKLQEALQQYEQALALNAHSPEAHFDRGLVYLLTGQFKQAWQEHIWRPSLKKRDIPSELQNFRVITQQKTLEKKRFLLKREQGLGDELFFLRFAPALKAMGAQLIYQCGDKLSSILNRQKIFKQIILSRQEIKSYIDYELFIGDLPLISNAFTSIQTPPPLPLSVLPARLTAMQIQLAQLGHPPYIGITWRAGTQREQWSVKRALYKEIDLQSLAVALRPIQATFLALQRHPQKNEIHTLATLLEQPIYDFSHLNDDLEDMLALLASLDNYVGVSNTNIHLLAGLRKTAHVLIPFPPDWRWLASGEESPWFKEFALYRQNEHLDWTNVLKNLTDDLLVSIGSANAVP